MNNNNICITCTNGVYDFEHKWFDIFDLCDGDYEELKSKFEMPANSYLLVTDCENKIGKLFLDCTNQEIIDEITDKIRHLNYIGINDEYMDLADQLLHELDFDELDGIEYVARDWDELIDMLIESWNLPAQAEMYIDREAVERDLDIELRIVTTDYGLYEVV